MRSPDSIRWLRRCCLLLVLLGTPAAFAGGLKRVAELPEVPFINPEQLSAHRYLQVAVAWDKEGRRTVMPRFQLFDMQERAVVEVPLPLPSLPKAHRAILGDRPSPTLVHHDGQVTSFVASTFDESYHQVATYFCQFDHGKGQFSELQELARHDDTRYFYSVGFDPTDSHYYFASAVNPNGGALKEGPTSMELARLDLKTRAIDWSMTLALPKRDQPLKVRTGPFSADGKKLALIEYADPGQDRRTSPKPGPQVLVLDLPAKQVQAHPAPKGAGASVFSPDGRTLIVGSNETGELLRIDLAKKKITARAKGPKYVSRFVPTPSGESFLAFGNTQRVSRKVVQVLGFKDLKPQLAIPARLLFPGKDDVSQTLFVGNGGRLLVLPYLEPSGFPARKGVRLYEVPEDLDSAEVEGSGLAAKAAHGHVLAKQYADARKIRYPFNKVDQGTFGQTQVLPNGDILLTGIFSGNSDGDYQPGRTRPVVARLDAKGKRRWERVLARREFTDYEAGGVAVTADGGCIVSMTTYAKPGSPGETRLVKLDARGKERWDVRFPTGRGKPRRYGIQFELQADGSVKIVGHAQKASEPPVGWTALVDRNGKVLSDELEAR